jgi:hypothetical protein
MSFREDAFKLANKAARMEDDNKVMRTALESLKKRVNASIDTAVSRTELEQLIAYVESGIGEEL